MKKIPFILLALIVLVLMTATVLEKVYGSSFVSVHIYSSVPFVLLWGVLAVLSVIYLLKSKVTKQPAVMLLHVSFLLILTGALLTWLYGEQGVVHIRENQETTFFTNNEGMPKKMPFVIKLDDFRVVYYAGTRAPMDFVSSVTVSDTGRNASVRSEISMNHIFSYHGYRFYQSGYDEDEGGATLAVSHDPYGIAVTYSGYALLLLSIFLFFFSRNSHFHRLRKSPLLARSVVVFLLLAIISNAVEASHGQPVVAHQTSSATKPSAGQPNVLSRKIAAKFGDLYVLYNNRICPIQTLAKDFTVKLYGSSSYKGLTPEQVFTGWMFYHSDWKEQPMIKVKSKTVRRLLGIGGKYASLDDFYDKYNAYKLEDVLRKIQQGEPVEDRKGIEDADEKYKLISIFYSGELLKIFPYPAGGGIAGGLLGDNHVVDSIIASKTGITINWYSQGEALPDNMADDEWFFVRKSLDYVHEMVIKKDESGLSDMFAKLKIYQQQKAKSVLPSEGRFKAEKIYNGLIYTKFLAMFCVIIGLLSFLLYCNCLISNKNVDERVKGMLCLLAVVVFLYLTAVIGLRWYVSGYVPLSNGFETMQFMAWCSLLSSFILQKRFFMLLPFGFLLCGLTLMVAMLGESNPRITQLMPVLSSPLLSIHVAVIMVAYSLFAFMMLNGVTAVILFFTKKESGADLQIQRLHVVSQLILYPAVFCLAVGIFVGAVWANISWGRYWGWDPKEVWALITMLVYALALHTVTLPRFRRPMFFHVFAIIAFLTVLITYFGVNFLLGGMHSYA